MSTEPTVASSVAHVTDDRAAHAKKWYAAVVRVNCERRVSQRLDAMGLENFVPLQRQIRIWSDRRKVISRVVIPMIVFVRADERECRAVRDCSFIMRLLGVPGQSGPATIPDCQVERFRHMLLCTESPVNMEDAPLQAGQSVLIARGSLRGLCGELTGVSRSGSHVIVRIEGLGCAGVDIPSDYVERVV